jgi:hypothetical protein
MENLRILRESLKMLPAMNLCAFGLINECPPFFRYGWIVNERVSESEKLLGES